MFNKIEHIGIAVKNLEESIALYEKMLGVSCYKIETVASEGVQTAFFLKDSSKIELVAAQNPDSAIAKFIEKKGEGIHHLAFAVENIDDKLSEVADAGIRLIDTKPRKGADGLDIAFLHPASTSGVLIEICGNKH